MAKFDWRWYGIDNLGRVFRRYRRGRARGFAYFEDGPEINGISYHNRTLRPVPENIKRRLRAEATKLGIELSNYLAAYAIQV